MQSSKTNVCLVEWDNKGEDVLTALGYQFRFILSEEPNPGWQKSFGEAVYRIERASGVSFGAKLEKLPNGKTCATIYGKPSEFKSRLYPTMRTVVDQANHIYDERVEAQARAKEAELHSHQQREKARLDEERALDELKKEFVLTK